MFQAMPEKAAELPPVSQIELPPALKLYTAAVLLHKLSIQMADEPILKRARGFQDGRTGWCGAQS